MPRAKRPRLGGAINCEAVLKRAESGKLDCLQVFTAFRAWAYPTSIRNWLGVVTISSCPPPEATVVATIRTGRETPAVIGTGPAPSMAPTGIEMGWIVPVELHYRFGKEGHYAVEFAVDGVTGAARSDLVIVTEPWPQFSAEELDLLSRTSQAPRAMRVTVQCAQCSSPQVFEATPLPDHEFASNVQPFPESGTVDCGCGHTLHLRDIHGQSLAAIKGALTQAMRRQEP